MSNNHCERFVIFKSQHLLEAGCTENDNIFWVTIMPVSMNEQYYPIIGLLNGAKGKFVCKILSDEKLLHSYV